MRTLLILFVVLISLTACSIPREIEISKPRVVDFSKIQIRDGIAYCINEDKPFTGAFIEIYENGQKKSEGNFKDGEFDGKVTSWHENGQIEREEYYKDGKLQE